MSIDVNKLSLVEKALKNTISEVIRINWTYYIIYFIQNGDKFGDTEENTTYVEESTLQASHQVSPNPNPIQ